ncbi:rCG43297 [Rattus norvegicus]|uniref:RCG43297 n=1 Tax=Rattus norvegicus TaxID=10116 RepID=A6IWE6_RAT|nr:rCG43297 [Rattus norvegicus]
MLSLARVCQCSELGQGEHTCPVAQCACLMWICAHESRCLRRPEALDFLDVELYMIGSS